MNTLKLLTFLLMSILVQSCFKDDDMVMPHNPGNVRTDTAAMTSNYRYQVYFDLGTGRNVSSNNKTDSDLGFDCSSSGWYIILNTSDFMKAADLGIVPFGQPQDTAGMVWKFDKSDGNPDSLAIGKWFMVNREDTISNQHVYVIDRGMDEYGVNLGLVQVIFDSLRHGTYYFRFAGINGGNIISKTVTKDASVNYLYFSFKSGGLLKGLEPPKNSFDLLFTQYTTLLYTDLGEPYPYLVTGVLINRNNVEVVLDSLHDFNTLTFDQAKTLTFGKALDAIGYDWKYYDFDAGSYTVRTGMLYVIRDTEGYYYKFRFISFYNALGEKGYPVFEYQEL